MADVMDAKEVKKLRDDELKSEVARLRTRLFDLRQQTVTEKVENTAQFGQLKKTIARLLTEQKARTSKTPAKA